MSIQVNSPVIAGTGPHKVLTAANMPDASHDTRLGGHLLVPEADRPTCAAAADAKASAVQISLGGDGRSPIFPAESIVTLREMRDSLRAVSEKMFGSSLHKDEDRQATVFERKLQRYLLALHAMKREVPTEGGKIEVILKATAALKKLLDGHENLLNQAAEDAYSSARDPDDALGSAPRGPSLGTKKRLSESAKAIAQQKRVLLEALEGLAL